MGLRMTKLVRRRTSTLTLGALGFLVISALAATLIPRHHLQPSHASAPPTLSAATPQSPRFTSIRLVNPTMIDMKRAGARGDGATDDSARIQAVIDQAPDNTSFYFPAGTYKLASVVISNRSHLEFYGDGVTSVLQWSGAGLPRSWTPMMTFTGVTDVLVHDLAFDNRSITTFGGVAFYASKRVEIKNTSFTDSNRQTPNGIDRYSYVFGRGAGPHEDLKIHDNVITNLQLEVDHAQRVEIRDNIVTRGTQTAGIGLFSLASGGVMQDYLIDGNIVIDPEPTASGIAVHLDPPAANNSSIRRIRISNNSVLFNTAGAVGISIGTPYLPARTHGNTFQDLAIEGNLIRAHSSAPPTAELVRILSNGDFNFSRLVLRGNVMLGNGRLAEGADGSAQVRYTQDHAIIAGNALRRAVKGLGLVASQETHIMDNMVETAAGPAYVYAQSRGRNVFRNNHLFGAAAQPVSYEDAPHRTDLTEIPTRAPDAAAPTIDAVRISNITDTSAEITWQTSKPATSEAEYSTDLSYNRTTYPRPPFRRRHALSLVNLRPNTSYNVRVRSIDITGTEAMSQNHTFTTRGSLSQPR